MDEINYSALSAGTATVEIGGVELDKPVYLETAENTYNLPDCQVNGKSISAVLVQKYHFYFLHHEYGIRVALFVLFVILNVFTLLVVLTKEDKKSCLLAQMVLTVSYICLSFIYDSSLFLSPTWAGVVTNFAHSAMNAGFIRNLVIADAGYLPLLQRLITLFIFRILHVSPYFALYMMQICAYILSGCMLSFFTKWQFRNYFPLKDRYLISLIFFMQIIDRQTGAFINFIVYGIFIILLYFLSDSREWGRSEFIFLCLFGGMACLSKGSFVTILPLMFVAVCLLYKRFNKGDWGFVSCCFGGALMQLIYYCLRVDINWFDKTGTADDPHFLLKLICSVFVDVPNNILSLFEGNISAFNGVSLLVIFSFWFLVGFIFLKHIIIPFLEKRSLDRDYLVFFLILLYIMGQGLFFRITVYGTSPYDIGTDEFWLFANRGVGGRYQIFLYLAAMCFFIVSIKIVKKRNLRSVERAAVIGFAVCVMIANPRFQLKGMGTDSYAANRNYLSTMYAETGLMKDIKDAECRIVPIQPNGVNYKKNANLYCFGENVLGWNGVTTVPESSENDFSHGSVNLLDFRTVDNTCGIWQVFVSRVSLINNKIYRVIVKDASGNVILQKEQDNTNYQNIVSFTFDSRVPDVASIEIRDIDGNRVYIRNGIYVVTKTGERMILAGK